MSEPQTDADKLTTLLGRERHHALAGYRPQGDLGKVLVTGAAGSVGEALMAKLWNIQDPDGPTAVGTDIKQLDVTSALQVGETLSGLVPNTVFHLAGAKHAPEGEEDPGGYAVTNITGAENVFGIAKALGARVVFASTCKACDPETVYGATKLVAERMALELGHSVARFHNITRSSGNVFEIWEKLPEEEPIRVTDCKRRFITMDEAIGLLLYAADPRNAPGRYTVFPTVPRFMPNVAWELYPKREVHTMGPRRGDRMVEPSHAVGERAQGVGINFGAAMILSPHDPQ